MEILTEVVKAIDNQVSDNETKVDIYKELIPHLRWHDIDVAESLREESEAYAEAYERILDEEDSSDDE